MKKLITPLFTLLLATTFTSFAAQDDQLIDVDVYIEELNSALNLYQASDFDVALPALEKIAKRGNKNAQYIVGTMYLNAQGTKQNLLKSYAWLKVANEKKSNSWKRPLKMLEEKLPESFLQKASFEAESYVSKYGTKTQRVKCRNIKTLGSKRGVDTCKKIEVKPGYYFEAAELEIKELSALVN